MGANVCKLPLEQDLEHINILDNLLVRRPEKSHIVSLCQQGWWGEFCSVLFCFSKQRGEERLHSSGVSQVRHRGAGTSHCKGTDPGSLLLKNLLQRQV